MKNKKTITLLVLTIAVLSAFVNIVGLLSTGGEGQHDFTAVTGEKVQIYGEGIYKNDSISVVAQGKAADLVTLVFAVPLLLVALVLATRNSFRGRLLLTGTLGYFLYTYVSYVFLWSYNQLFLVYVILMSLSIFSFVLSMMTFNTSKISQKFSDKLPRKFLGGFQIFVAVTIALMWLGRIFESKVPFGLEHYTTLVIQAMDLGIVVPVALLSGILLIKKKPYGYLLSSVIIIKGITMLAAICAMIVNSAIEGIEISMVETVVFSLFTLLAVFSLVILLNNVELKKYREVGK